MAICKSASLSKLACEAMGKLGRGKSRTFYSRTYVQAARKRAKNIDGSNPNVGGAATKGSNLRPFPCEGRGELFSAASADFPAVTICLKSAAFFFALLYHGRIATAAVCFPSLPLASPK